MNRSITLPKALRCYPSVYAFRDFYRIFACFNCHALVWVRVGEKTYYDHSNGVLRSNSPIHSVEVPMEELDRAREYTVCYRKIIERKVYYPTSEDTVEVTFAFRPVTGYPIRIYQLSDVHNLTDVALRAGVFWGDDIDLLIFNGDLPDHCANIERLEVIYDLASAITHGEVPVIFSRGNHDLRGSFAEHFSEHTPTAHGLPYFTFRLGPIWGMVLDTGEDKPDGVPEYGYTTCFHQYRLEEDAFIRRVIERREEEYDAEGVEYKLIISHAPVSFVSPPPFDIELELFGEWARLLREAIKPDLGLHGHTHRAEISPIGGPRDHLGQACTLIFGCKPTRPKEGAPAFFVGNALVIERDSVRVIFNDCEGNILLDETIRKEKLRE